MKKRESLIDAAIFFVVAVVAFRVNFVALSDLASQGGFPDGLGWGLPLIIDVVIIGAMRYNHRLSTRTGRRDGYAIFLVAAGSLVSVAANVAHTWHEGRVDILVSTVAPLGLLAASELLAKIARENYAAKVAEQQEAERREAAQAAAERSAQLEREAAERAEAERLRADAERAEAEAERLRAERAEARRKARERSTEQGATGNGSAPRSASAEGAAPAAGDRSGGSERSDGAGAPTVTELSERAQRSEDVKLLAAAAHLLYPEQGERILARTATAMSGGAVEVPPSIPRRLRRGLRGEQKDALRDAPELLERARLGAVDHLLGAEHRSALEALRAPTSGSTAPSERSEATAPEHRSEPTAPNGSAPSERSDDEPMSGAV